MEATKWKEQGHRTPANPAGRRREGRVLIAMSGGVDSSVTAYLMKEAGWDCLGVTMSLYEGDAAEALPGVCGSARDAEDAAAVAARLDMPHRVLDLQEAFRHHVIDHFVRAYEEGRTPNPCIDCNREMKFGRLLDYAHEAGCSHIASGHYARVEWDEARGRFLLKKGLDPKKDQSYVLYMLRQEQLSCLHLPLGERTKEEIRALAAAQGFANAQKAESQDICFVRDGDYAGFMEAYSGHSYPPGHFLDMGGNVIGEHRGAVRYTTGQRKGLGLAMGSPVYVQGKDMEANTVTVGPEASLFHRRALVADCNWISVADVTEPLQVMAMPRYRKKEAPALITPLAEETVEVLFDEPQRAMTEGQAMVFYQDDLVIGGGTILRVGD